MKSLKSLEILETRTSFVVPDASLAPLARSKARCIGSLPGSRGCSGRSPVGPGSERSGAERGLGFIDL